MNNLYNFNNSNNNEFIYDEVNEKIFPLKNFEGESFPENLYREENNIDFKDLDLKNKLKKQKINEFNQSSSSGFGKMNKMSNSKIKFTKKTDSNSTGYVSWNKIVKEKIKDNLEPQVIYSEFNHGIGLRK